MKRVKFIYNPASGEAGLTDELDAIVAVHQERGYSLVPYRLTFDGDPADAVSDIDDSYSHVLVAGGDGTVNFVVNLLKDNGIDKPMGLLPTGTANDFAALFGIPSDPVKACRAMLEGEVVPVDVGRVNGSYFVNVLSCGLFTDLSQKTPTVLKNTFGKLAYYVGGLGEIPRFRKMHIRLESDGGDFEGNCVIFFVFNGRTAGSLKLAYLSEPDDGLLDVMVVKGDNPLDTLRTAMRYFTLSLKKKEYPAGIEHIRCTRLRAECDPPEPTDTDGQAGPGFPLEIACEKGGLKLLLPRPAEKRRRRK